jgi:hypothetical protein
MVNGGFFKQACLYKRAKIQVEIVEQLYYVYYDELFHACLKQVDPERKAVN